MSARTHFAAWGLVSLVAMVFGLCVGVLAALVQQGLVPDFSVAGISFLSAAFGIVVGPLIGGGAVGCIALYFGRQLACEVCGSKVLPPDEQGFRGLRAGPVLSAYRGRCLCPPCSGASPSEWI